MDDPRFVYRPLLDLLGYAEGTDPVPGNPARARGYNETLSYGRFTGGPVNLVAMTLDEVDALQTRMLAHPDNHFNSSAVGRYQIVRTTLRSIRERLGLFQDDLLFDEAMQDRMACFLLGRRGIDLWLRGARTTNQLIRDLAMEWASLPTPEGDGHYSGQSARVTIDQVTGALAEVRRRHERTLAQAPAPVPVPPDTVPDLPAEDQLFDLDVPAMAVRMADSFDADELRDIATAAHVAMAMQGGWTLQERRLPVAELPYHPQPETPQEGATMTGVKQIFQSKTILGLVIAALAQYSPLAGFAGRLLLGNDVPEIDPANVQALVSAMENAITAIGLVFAAFGRIVAKEQIKVPGLR